MSRTALRLDEEMVDFPSTRNSYGAIASGVLYVLAAALLISLLISRRYPSLIGAAGAQINAVLLFTFGRVGAYGIPAFLGLTATGIILRWSWKRMVLVAMAVFVFTIALTAFISLGIVTTENYPRNDAFAFRTAGVLAEFIIHPYGLGLPKIIGPLACRALLISMMTGAGLVVMGFAPIRWLGQAILFGLRLLRGRHKSPTPASVTPAAAELNPTSALFHRESSMGRIFQPRPNQGFSTPPPLAGDRPAIDEGIRAIMTNPTPPVDLDSNNALHGMATTGKAGAVMAPATTTDSGGIEIVYPEKPFSKDKNLEAGPAAPLDLDRAGRLGRPPVEAQQEELDLFIQYQKPPMNLLSLPPADSVVNTPPEELKAHAELLEQKLLDFKIEAQVVKITQGPTITRFEVKPAPGIKVSKIASLEKDMAMAMSALSVRIQAPIPGKDTVGIEAPNKHPNPVFLREIMDTSAFRDFKKPLPFCLGKTISGQPMVVELASMPHLLIAGTTGSGKSVCLNGIICSFLMRYAPDELKMIMIDPKRVELNVYQHIPHLLAPVVSDPRKASGALNWMVEEMEKRYKLLAEFSVRNIDGYNSLFDPTNPSKKIIGRNLALMPRIVVIIDELADLMLVAKNEVEEAIIRLAQMARAVGIHLILATQRPSVNVITGIIKANFPARIAFQVSSNVDSRTILDMKGAEALLGKGDMLYLSGITPRPERLQGCFVSDKEVEDLADFIRAQQRAVYVKEDFEDPKEKETDSDDKRKPTGGSGASRDGSDWELMGQMSHNDGQPMDSQEIWSEYLRDDLFRAAARLILQHNKGSVSLIQRRLKIGFARSGRLMDMMEEAGIVGEYKGSKPREIRIDPLEYLRLIDDFEAMEDEE